MVCPNHFSLILVSPYGQFCKNKRVYVLSRLSIVLEVWLNINITFYIMAISRSKWPMMKKVRVLSVIKLSKWKKTKCHHFLCYFDLFVGDMAILLNVFFFLSRMMILFRNAFRRSSFKGLNLYSYLRRRTGIINEKILSNLTQLCL